MKILLTGVSGMLGADLWHVLKEAGHDLVGTDIKKPEYVPDTQWHALDITDQPKTFHIVSRCNPDIIIHTAAYTDVDGCEQDPDRAYRINGLGTRNLLLGAQRFDSAFLYISTDFVFGKNTKQEYTEYDCVSPRSQYAYSKLIGEQFVRDLSNKFYIVRISSLFGKNKSNYVLNMINTIRQGKAYRAARDMIITPTYSLDLARAILFLIEKNTYGIYHLTNGGCASRYEVGCEIARLLNVEVKKYITEVGIDELKLPAPRPKNSVLKNTMWHLNGYPPMRHWKEAVKDFINTLT